MILREGVAEQSGWRITLAAVGLAAFAGKTLLELVLGHPLFVDSTASGFAPVPAAHVVGGVVGAAVAVTPTITRKTRHILSLARPCLTA